MISTTFDPKDTPLPLDYFARKYLVSRTSLWRYRKAGLPALGVGAKTFVRESDFIAFLERMNGKTVSAAPTPKAQRCPAAPNCSCSASASPRLAPVPGSSGDSPHGGADFKHSSTSFSPMNHDAIAEAKAKLPLPQLWRVLSLPGEPSKSCPCPLHEDSRNSGSVFQREDGHWAFKCHAGCGAFDEIDLIARVRNLSVTDGIREFKKLAGVVDSPLPTSAAGPQPSTLNSQPAFDWPACVCAFTPDRQAKFAQWRGLNLGFVQWLYGQGHVGLFRGRLAFAVREPDSGQVVRAHVRVVKKQADGSEAVFWFYSRPKGRTLPLLIGEPRTASTVWAFESQFDLCAALDLAGWHKSADGLPGVAAVATRGAENGKLLAGLCGSDATLLLFPQNDEAKPDRPETPAQKWTRETAAHAGCKAVQIVATPAGFKDLNDALRAGLTPEEFQAALAAAKPYTPLPDLHAAPRVRVSAPAIVLPPEDEDDAGDAPEAFPVGCLPAPLAGIVAAASRCQRTPPALPAACALGVCSASLGSGLEVPSVHGEVARANLFLLVSAESGSGKSQTFRAVAAPFLEHQARLLEEWRSKTGPKLQSDFTTAEAFLKKLTRQITRTADPAERERLSAEKTFRTAERDELLRRAAMPAIIAQDVTTERLAGLLRDNRETMFSACADARKLVDNLMGRYNPSGTTDESIYVSAYTGDFLKVDRKSLPEPIVLHRPCLTLLWLVQPDMLATMLGEQSLTDSGFLARCLTAHTWAMPQRIEGASEGIPEAVRSQWASLINNLLATYHGASKPYRLEAGLEARQVLIDYHNDIVDRRSGELADVGLFAARWAENAWRVALNLHAGLYGADAHNRSLEAETAQNAIRLVEWFSTQQLGILTKGRQQAAKKIEDEVFDLMDERMERQRLDYVTAKDVYRKRIVANAELAHSLLARMERDGLLVGEDVKPPGGGKVTRIFRRVTERNPVPE